MEPRVVQFWSEIIRVNSNRPSAQREFDFEIKRMVSDQIALHSVPLPLLIGVVPCETSGFYGNDTVSLVQIVVPRQGTSEIHKLISECSLLCVNPR